MENKHSLKGPKERKLKTRNVKTRNVRIKDMTVSTQTALSKGGLACQSAGACERAKETRAHFLVWRVSSDAQKDFLEVCNIRTYTGKCKNHTDFRKKQTTKSPCGKHTALERGPYLSPLKGTRLFWRWGPPGGKAGTHQYSISATVN